MADDLDDLDGAEGDPQPPHGPRADHRRRRTSDRDGRFGVRGRRRRKTSKSIGVTIKQANAPTATGPAGRGVHLGKRLPASSRYAAWPPPRQRPPKASLRGPLPPPALAGRAPESGQANAPLTHEPLGDGRPLLGGSPRQIAEDVARLEPAGVDQVLFASIATRDLKTEVGLLAELRAATAAAA